MAGTMKPRVARRDGEERLFYLFNDEQSVRIETIQMAMRGIADLTREECKVAAPIDHEINRNGIAAIFDLLAQSLEDAIGPDGRKSAYLKQADIKGSVQ